jgi:glucose/arabinose dehydrogenase
MRKLLATLAFVGIGSALSALPALAQDLRIAALPVVDGLELPVFATAPASDPRLFIVEQTGRIRILADGALSPEPFLDISDRVSAGGEQGLLGLAFHPKFAENGRFFVNYTDTAGDTRVVAYTVTDNPTRVDPDSGTVLLAVDQPFANHNGGWIGFGPEGLLHIGLGDGGAGGDPGNRAQNPESLLGKLLRIDVDSAQPYSIPADNPFADGGGAPEVYMLGLRNPWRIAFDGDQLYIADVGQNAYEEITVLPRTAAGANLGWRIVEGPACFSPESGCDMTGLVAPAHSYSHADGGCSITGGYVYRGRALPELDGQYFFADYCAGFVRSMTWPSGEVVDWTGQLGNLGNISSFGTDSAGELYIMTLEGSLDRLGRG